MSEQIAVRIPDELSESLEDLVASGRFETKAEAVRTALGSLQAATKEGNDPKVIRARMADLEQAAKSLSVAMLDDSLKRSLQGKKVSEVTKS